MLYLLHDFQSSSAFFTVPMKLSQLALAELFAFMSIVVFSAADPKIQAAWVMASQTISRHVQWMEKWLVEMMAKLVIVFRHPIGNTLSKYCGIPCPNTVGHCPNTVEPWARNYEIHCKAEAVTLNCSCRILRRMVWSTHSKAAVKSAAVERCREARVKGHDNVFVDFNDCDFHEVMSMKTRLRGWKQM